jgi:flagellar motility protein MotE (MotC chaperone)
MKAAISFNPMLWGVGALGLMLAIRVIQPYWPDQLPTAQTNSLADNISRSFEKRLPAHERSVDIVTGSTQEPKKPQAATKGEQKTETGNAEAAESEQAKGATEKAGETPKGVSSGAAAPDNISVPETITGEKTLLERLAARRQQIDEKEKALGEREALLAAAEQRIEQRIAELKAADSELKTTLEAKKNEQVTIKPLVTMYESMKPKEAAKIFEKLQLADLLPIAQAMNPRKLSEILAQLDPVMAGKLTVSMAPVTVQRSAAQITNSLPELPDLPVTAR